MQLSARGEFLVPPGQVGTERIDGLDQRNLRAPAAIEFVVQPDLHRCRELRQSRVYLGLDLCPTSSTPRHAVPLPQPVEHHRECSLPAHSRGKHPDRDSRMSGFCRNTSRSVVRWPRRRGPGGGAGSRARCGGRSTRPTGRRARGSCTRRCGSTPPGRARPASPRAPRRRRRARAATTAGSCSLYRRSTTRSSLPMGTNTGLSSVCTSRSRSRCTSSTSRTWHAYSNGDHTSGAGRVRTRPSGRRSKVRRNAEASVRSAGAISGRVNAS